MENTQFGSPARRAESQDGMIYGISCSVVALSCLTIGLRLYTRRIILHTLGPDDVAILIAGMLNIGVLMTVVFQIKHGMGRHTEFVSPAEFLEGAKALYANSLVYNAAHIVTKISFLLQYRRIFQTKITYKLCTFGMVFLAIWGITQQFITAFSCVPLQIIVPKWSGRCIPAHTVYNVNAIMNVITDVAIFAIPVHPVLRLQMDIRRKINLLVVFSLGFFACAISIIRLHQLSTTNNSPDPLWAASSPACWSAIELNIGILCACLPTLRPLVRQLIPQSLRPTEKAQSTHQLNTISSKKTNARASVGVFMHKDIEFQSTTELRSEDPGLTKF